MMLFVDVVKYKSFTAAAEKNEKTAAAVSKRISQLEHSLGAKLLKRTTRTLALTVAGEILYRQCSSMQLELSTICEQVVDAHNKPKGKIKISALQNFSNIILSNILEKFLQTYSDVEFEINLDGALGPLPPIGDYDVAFRCGRLEDSSAISRRLLTHDYVVCASPSYIERNGVPSTLDDLANHNCLDCHHGTREDGRAWTFFDGDEAFHIPVKSNVFTSNALLVKHLAVSGVSLVYSPSFIVAKEINDGLLIPVLQQYKTITNSIYMIHPYANVNLPKRIRCFIDFLFDNLSIPSISEKHQNLSLITATG